MGRGFRDRAAFLLALTIFGTGSVAKAQPDYGLDFVTIGDPGNRNTNNGEAPLLPFGPLGRHVGAVDYEYRLMRNEVTMGQYTEFVNAYIPHYSGNPQDLAVDSLIVWNGSSFDLAPEHENYAVRGTAFPFAAAMCNWLHNGKAAEAWAFEDGAYDMSLFTFDPDTGQPNDTHVHRPGAKYWIPSIDEWIKGMHWDPAKDGVGGYWQYPDSGDELMTPEETDAYPQPGDFLEQIYGPVGLFPDSQSPWGLLGGAGGAGEWTETVWLDPLFSDGGRRFYRPSERDDTDPTAALLGRTPIPGYTWEPFHGFRLASPVPAPSVLIVTLVGVVPQFQRRRECSRDTKAGCRVSSS